MQEEVNYENCGAMIVEAIKQLPAHYLQIVSSCANHPKYHTITHSQKQISQLQKNLIGMNRQAIQDKFISMSNDILSDIQLKLKKSKGHWKKFSDFEKLISARLDKTIYPRGLNINDKNISKSSITPDSQKESYQINKSTEEKNNQQIADHADLFFTQLFQVMGRLLFVMKQFYGYEKDEQIQVAMYTALIQFMQNNQHSFIAQQDRLSMSRVSSQRSSIIDEQQPQQTQENTYKKALFDVLESISSKKKQSVKEKSGKQQKNNQSFYSLVYKAVANNVPFFSSSTSIQSQKSKLRQELMSMLKKQKNSENFKLTPEQKQIIGCYIEYDSSSILEAMSQDSRQQFIEFVSNVMTEPECQQFLQQTKAHQELANAVGSAYEVKNNGKMKTHILWIILLYKAFEPKYCASRRYFLLSVCKKPQLINNLKNPSLILKNAESYFQKQSQILKAIRKLPALQTQKKQFKKLNDRKTDDLSLMIEHELHRIHLYELKKKFDKPIMLQIDRLKDCEPKKNISFLFSGFLSEDSCKYSEWGAMVQSGFDSEMYSLRWESKSIADIGKFIYSAGVDVVGANIGIGAIAGPYGPYLKAAAIVKQIYTKYQTNPFNPAFQCAKASGQFIAELFISSFQDNFINLVGFSLGTQLIYHILKRLVQRKKSDMINTIFLMGGVADKVLFQKLLTQVPHSLRIVNMRSENDYILKYLLKLCKSQITPIGLNIIDQKIKPHKIKNIDATGLVNGHLAYRDNLKLVEMMMNVNDS